MCGPSSVVIAPPALRVAPLLLLPPRRSCDLSYPSPVAPASDFVGCCVSWTIGVCLNIKKNCFMFVFAP
jgi:hypothetical protein